MSGSSAGIGFAIPVDTLKYEVNTLIQYGKISRPAIGVSYLDSTQSKLLGIQQGILILDIPVNSEAQKAGLQGTYRDTSGIMHLGDIIIGINDELILNESDLFKAIERHQVNDIIQVKVIRTMDLEMLNNFLNENNNNNNEDENLKEKFDANNPNLPKNIKIITVPVKLSNRPEF
jgi:S1-C subfamily serine protease